MFCSSLRKRPEWTSVPPTLLSQKHPKWQEKMIETHDLAIPLPPQNDYFRLILMSSTETQGLRPNMDRIERLYHQTGGRHVGIVFLVEDGISRENGMRSFMQLQASLLPTFEIPIVPLFSVSSLQSTLFRFQRQFIAAGKSVATGPRSDPSTALLPYCTVNAPIPEHDRNVLSEIYHSIPGVAQAASSSDGQEGLKKWLEPAVADGIIDFWGQEYIVE